jgi:hypothetical protein
MESSLLKESTSLLSRDPFVIILILFSYLGRSFPIGFSPFKYRTEVSEIFVIFPAVTAGSAVLFLFDFMAPLILPMSRCSEASYYKKKGRKTLHVNSREG